MRCTGFEPVSTDWKSAMLPLSPTTQKNGTVIHGILCTKYSRPLTMTNLWTRTIRPVDPVIRFELISPGYNAGNLPLIYTGKNKIQIYNNIFTSQSIRSTLTDH